MANKKEFGSVLKRTRLRNKKIYKDFGSRRSYIYYVEVGKTSPTLERINEIAEILKVDPLCLIFEAYASSKQGVSTEDLLSNIRSYMAEIEENKDTKLLD